MTEIGGMDSVKALMKTADDANEIARATAEILRWRDAQLEIAMDALIAIATGSTDPRTVAGRALGQMRAVTPKS